MELNRINFHHLRKKVDYVNQKDDTGISSLTVIVSEKCSPYKIFYCMKHFILEYSCNIIEDGGNNNEKKKKVRN